jgi:hypothetical protein
MVGEATGSYCRHNVQQGRMKRRRMIAIGALVPIVAIMAAAMIVVAMSRPPSNGTMALFGEDILHTRAAS